MKARRRRRPLQRAVQTTAARRDVRTCCRAAQRVACDCAHATECDEHGESHAAHADEQ